MPDVNASETWGSAHQVAGRLGHIPSSFMCCIRSLRNDAKNNKNEFGAVSRFCLQRLLKSESLRAIFYYCAATFYAEKLDKYAYLSTESFLEIFRADDVAMILALLILSRQIKKRCDPEEWKNLSKVLDLHVDAGGLIGQSLPGAGLATGALAAGLRQLACAMFLSTDKFAFANYRKSTRRKNTMFDPDEERNSWGCSHMQLASLLTQPVGLGAALGKALSVGLSPQIPPRQALSKEAAAIRACRIWLDSLMQDGRPPDPDASLRSFPEEQKAAELVEIINHLRRDGSPFHWLTKGRKNIAPATTPQLFPPANYQIPAPQDAGLDPEGSIAGSVIKELDPADLAQLDDDAE